MTKILQIPPAAFQRWLRHQADAENARRLAGEVLNTIIEAQGLEGSVNLTGFDPATSTFTIEIADTP